MSAFLWRLWVIVAAMVGWMLVVVPVGAQTPQPDLALYTTWVREAYAAAQRSDRLALEQVADRLTSVTAVRLPDDVLLATDNSWLRDALRANEPDMDAISARLGAIIDALAQPISAAPADAQARLQDILNRPPFYQPPRDPATSSWLIDVLNWLGRVLDGIFGPPTRTIGARGNVFGWVLAVVGGVLLIGVIVYLLVGVRRMVVREARLPDDDLEAHLTAKVALNQAGDLARDGDYRTAARFLYLSALLWLDEHGLLRYDRALTNREYLERLRDNPALFTQLSPIIETFDQVWYGHVPMDAEAFAVYRAQVESLRRES